jgi:NAD(P)-dependent dehydrogenase (short-subunit alcohol dehydrogenase family)
MSAANTPWKASRKSAAIVFISSDKASYIIGASLAVDGGMTAD